MIVGVIGGIGSGKSLVTDILKEEYGFIVLDSDSIALSMEEPGGTVYAALIAEFGSDILAGDKIDKKKLAAIIYSDRAMEQRANAIVHPPVIAYIDDFVGEHPGADIAIETALPWASLRSVTDLMIYVRAGRELRIERLIDKRGMDRERAERIMSMQPDDAEYLRLSDLVIDNELDPGSVRALVREALG